MKKYIFTALLGLSCLFAYSKEFQDNNIWYETLSDNTCQTLPGSATINFQSHAMPSYHGLSMCDMEPQNKDLNIDNNVSIQLYGEPKNYDQNRKTLVLPETVKDENGKEYTVVRIGEYSFTGNSGCNIEDLTIPKTVKEIGTGAFFSSNGKMKNITFEGGEESQLESIGDYAFYKAKELASLSIPDNVTKIGKFAFAFFTENNGNATLSLGKHLKEIDEYAFFKCRQLKDLVIPDNVTKIGKFAFAYFSDGNGNATLTLGENLQYIDDYAFYWCKQIKSLVIPNSVYYIGDYAFFHCDQLKEVVFGQNVNTIGEGCFVWGAFEINLPASIKEIGDRAFNLQDYKNNIHNVYCNSVTVPSLNMAGFGCLDQNVHQSANGHWIYAFCCLHVPQGTREAYKADPAWSQFSCIIDDLIPEAADPSEGKDPDPMPSNSIQNIVGYMFIPLEPNVDNSVDTYQITREVFPSYVDIEKIEVWEVFNEPAKDDEKIIFLNPADKTVTPNKLGEQLILGYNVSENKVSDGSKWVEEKSLVGAVMVFVCPTVTLVYGEIEPDENTVAQSQSKIKTMAVNDEGTDYDKETSAYSTYQHQTIFNSYPKFEITSPKYITFTTYEKGHFDENGSYTNDYENLTEIGEDQKVGEGSTTDDEGYIVPLTSITENRVIKVSAAVDVQDPNNTTTGVSDLQTPGFRIYAKGRTVYIEGAEEGSIADIFDLSGKKVLSTTEKTFQLSDAGVYILELGDYAVKIVVR